MICPRPTTSFSLEHEICYMIFLFKAEKFKRKKVDTIVSFEKLSEKKGRLEEQEVTSYLSNNLHVIFVI